MSRDQKSMAGTCGGKRSRRGRTKKILVVLSVVVAAAIFLFNGRSLGEDSWLDDGFDSVVNVIIDIIRANAGHLSEFSPGSQSDNVDIAQRSTVIKGDDPRDGQTAAQLPVSSDSGRVY